MSVSFSVHVSDAYSSTLKTHVVNTLSFLSIFSLLLFRMCFREAIAPVAFPILLLISSEQLLSHVSKLTKYSNLSTFPMVSPKTIVSVFFVFKRSPACSAASFVSSSWLRSELTSSYQITDAYSTDVDSAGVLSHLVHCSIKICDEEEW